MLSQVMLGKIDSRLRQAKNTNNLFFGGLSMMLIGDPGQLLPVAGSSLYDTKLKSTLAIAGYLAYKKFDIVITLEAVMRQQNLDNDPDQAHFMDLLPRLRNGTSTIKDWKLLLTRIPTEENMKEFENATYIFNDNENVDRLNLEELTKKKSPVTELKAINSSKKGLSTSSQQFGGLVNSLFISEGCNISIINNLWIKKGKKTDKKLLKNKKIKSTTQKIKSTPQKIKSTPEKIK